MNAIKVSIVLFFLCIGLFNNVLASESFVCQDNIPEKIQNFLDEHFSNYIIEKLKYDAEDGEYKIKYKNGIKIEFEHNGEWKKIESDYTPLPKTIIDILPGKIIGFIAKKYPQKPIRSIKRKTHYYKIKLDGDLDLELDYEGNIIKV